MASTAERESDARQPDGKGPERVTTIRRAISIGAVVAVLVGGTSLATARLTDRQSDLDRQRAEITQLAGQVSQQEAQIAELTGQAGGTADEADRLNAEIAVLSQRVLELEATKLSLEEQLSQYINPAPGPTPSAVLTVNWVDTDSRGHRVICVTIENTSDGPPDIYYSYTQFSAVDRDNYVYSPRLHTPGYGIQLYTPLVGGQLGPGEKGRGELLYDVAVQPPVLTKLVWNLGFGETPDLQVDLPPASREYSIASVC